LKHESVRFRAFIVAETCRLASEALAGLERSRASHEQWRC
jgi:hypothetical protein